jgi:hypothetical protein
VLAATTSAQVGAELSELTNVVIAHRMNDEAAARHLATAAGEPGGLAALRDGEFLLAVKDPHRLVPRGQLVRARTPQLTHADRHAAEPQDALKRWEGV